MDERDLELRNLTYGLFVELGRAPTPTETAARAGLAAGDVVAGWRRLHDAHALVLNPATDELRMANPFSAVPTAYRVLADGRWWFANCAWDAFGICAALGSDGRIETSLQGIPGLSEISTYGKIIRARAERGASAIPLILSALERENVAVAPATLARPSLDDVYLRYAGHAYHDADPTKKEAA